MILLRLGLEPHTNADQEKLGAALQQMIERRTKDEWCGCGGRAGLVRCAVATGRRVQRHT